MTPKEITVIAVNTVLAVGMLVLFGFSRITWDQLAIALGLLVTPSAGGLLLDRAKGTPPAPPAPADGGAP